MDGLRRHGMGKQGARLDILEDVLHPSSFPVTNMWRWRNVQKGRKNRIS